MSYTKTTWSTGDTITAEKLNNIETGIKNNDDNAKIFIVNIESPDLQNFTADHTFEQLLQAYNNGYNILAKIGDVVTNALPHTSNNEITGFDFKSTTILDFSNSPQLAYAIGIINTEGPLLQYLNFFELTPIQNESSL